jgi:acetoacetate decarboxylase
MKIEQVLNIPATPINASPYTLNPSEFRNREYISIIYETDMERLIEVVPEPQKIEAPLVRFEFMRMPDSSPSGDYLECGQLIPVSFHEEKGEFNLCMYVDNFPAVAAGREISAYPKKMAKPSFYIDSDTIVAKLAYGTIDVAVATMGYKHVKMPVEDAKKEISTPQFMLKIIRDYKRQPLVLEMIRTKTTKFEVLEAWKSPARLQLFEHVAAPLADLPVKRIVNTSHIITTNLVLGGSEPVFNYLQR